MNGLLFEPRVIAVVALAWLVAMHVLGRWAYWKIRAKQAQPFPFTQPAGSDVDMFIQWKGTDLCMDLRCPCGCQSHVDAEFAHYVQCPACGTVYQMGTQVIAKRFTGDPHIEPKEGQA